MFEIACGLKIRAGNAFDQKIVQGVVQHNRYRLPSRFSPDDVVLDIGAHVGSFSYSCLARGAGRVYVFEPEEDNFRLCNENLSCFGERAVLHQAAVWRSDKFEDELLFTGPPESAQGVNFGGGNVVFEDGHRIHVKCVPLDSVLSNIRRVRLMKLDCESSEWLILFSSRLLEC